MVLYSAFYSPGRESYCEKNVLLPGLCVEVLRGPTALGCAPRSSECIARARSLPAPGPLSRPCLAPRTSHDPAPCHQLGALPDIPLHGCPFHLLSIATPRRQALVISMTTSTCRQQDRRRSPRSSEQRVVSPLAVRIHTFTRFDPSSLSIGSARAPRTPTGRHRRRRRAWRRRRRCSRCRRPPRRRPRRGSACSRGRRRAASR